VIPGKIALEEHWTSAFKENAAACDWFETAPHEAADGERIGRAEAAHLFAIDLG
jgi:hypothetical protein